MDLPLIFLFWSISPVTTWPFTHSTFAHLTLTSPPLRCITALITTHHTLQYRNRILIRRTLVLVFSMTLLSSHQWKTMTLPNMMHPLLVSRCSTTASCPVSKTQIACQSPSVLAKMPAHWDITTTLPLPQAMGVPKAVLRMIAGALRHLYCCTWVSVPLLNLSHRRNGRSGSSSTRR